MNEVENTVEATETPVAEESAPPAEPAAEETPAVESAPAPAPEPVQDDKNFDSVMKSLGDIPDEPNQQLMESIDEHSIEKLPDSAKGLLKHLIAKQNQEHKSRMAEFENVKKQMSEREKQIQDEAKRMIRNRAEMNRVLLDPKFQEFMKQANIPEEEMEDAFSEKGVEQRIAKGVAQAMTNFQKPFTEAAQRAQQMAAYQDFVDTHPLMKDKTFKTEVRQLMDVRREEGRPLALEDAYFMIDRSRMLKEQEAQVEKERQARARSARKISRQTMSNSVTPDEPIPNWVRTKGYQGRRGQQAVIHYLRDNPKALEALRIQQKRNKGR